MQGYTYFSYVCSKHRLWVPVRTGEAALTCTHYMYLCLSKNQKNIKIFLLKMFILFSVKNLCMLHGFVMDLLIVEKHKKFQIHSADTKTYIHIGAASWENQRFAYAKTKAQISFAVTAKLISAFVFATRIEQTLYFLNMKFHASSCLLWLYRPVCVGPVRKPHCWFSHEAAHSMYIYKNSKAHCMQ